MIRRCFVRGRATGLLLIAMLLLPPVASAQEPSQVDAQVREALHREIYGLAEEKQEILQEVIAHSPDAASARWHLGYVRQGNEWIKPTDLPARKHDPRLDGYRHRRSQMEDTAAGHMSLANWCQRRGLDERERAHLSRVIQLEVDHPVARERLGFVRVGMDWIHRDQIEAARTAQQQRARDLAEWDSEAAKLLRRLGSRSEAQREKALADIAALDKVEQVAILELRLATHSPEAAAAAITALGNMTGDQARDALARIAIFAVWQPTRFAAAERLGQWPVESYAPPLLAELYMPLQTEIQTAADPRGRLIYRHVFTREGQEENQQLILDTAYRRRARAGGSRNESLFWAMFQMRGQMVGTQMAAMRQQAFTGEMNRRICECLTLATGENLPANPQWWWTWWDEYNESSVEGEKTTRISYASQEVMITDRVQRQTSGGGTVGSGSPGQRSDCLVAGTLVWTEAGLRPIETISVGDMVLAQDAASGELAYKPVLRATVRPSGPLVRIEAGGETIESSGGHLFWVTGEGWVKATDMQSGAALYGMEGSTPVAKVSGQADQET